MHFDLSQLSIIAFVIASVVATAIYARRRMDIKVTNLYLDLKGKIEGLSEQLDDYGNSLAQVEGSTAVEVTRVSELLITAGERLESLNSRLSEQSHVVEELEHTRSDTNERMLLLSKRLSEFEGSSEKLAGLQMRNQQALNAVSEKVTEFDSSLRSFVEDTELQMSVDRVADVEHLAMIAAHMAGDSLARAGADAAGTVSYTVHGHALLMYQILLDRSTKSKLDSSNGFHVLEIGTTREKWWPQMSTSRLAALCRPLGLKMLSVDVDELSSAAGEKAKRFYGNTIEVRTEPGEEIVENWVGELPPYIYIDAYDFEHDAHSSERQQRYRALQGQEINNEACWAMHLRCAKAFVQKCPEGGIVVFDDVFFKDGAWSGKGKLAIPYMLERAFDVIAQTPKTAVFRRRTVGG